MAPTSATGWGGGNATSQDDSCADSTGAGLLTVSFPGAGLPAGAIITGIGVRLHASRGSMSLGESDGGLPPDSVVETETAILAESRRLAVTLHLQGHDRRSSATILGWQVKQVDNHKHRGLVDLRRCLEQKGHAP